MNNSSLLHYDIAVLGGGSAGLASALKASDGGASVVVFEREDRLGGILNQCIHNGFGLNYFKEELTGPEYANKFIEKVKNSNIMVKLKTTVLALKQKKIKDSVYYIITTLSEDGIKQFKVKSVILAMGCRERPSAAISLCGSRPAGVISAGSAQKLVNIHGKMIGKNIVIVGSGDIGLIMARRLKYEGANVLGVYEIMPNPSGLKRNIVQCLEDYNIPLHLSKTVVEVVGENRVEGIWVAPVKPDFSFELDKKEFIKCDAVVLSIGLVPEEDLAEKCGIKTNAITGGAEVDEYLQTSFKGVFSCGNVLHVHDIVDNVSKEAERAGENACKYVYNNLILGKKIAIKNGFGVRYVNPSFYYFSKEGILNVNFRVSKIFKNATIVVKNGEEIVKTFDKKAMLPAEMETIVLAKADLNKPLTIEIKEN